MREVFHEKRKILFAVAHSDKKNLSSYNTIL